MRGKRIVIGISGGIAAFKVASVVSQLSQRGADVRVIMTTSATQFITPLTLQTLSRNHVFIDTFDEKDPSVVSHIDLADHADLFVIAPATANVIGKVAHGIGDDMLTTTLLATTAPIVMCPAMNVHMYQNPLVQANMERLRKLKVQFIEPAEGQLACGYVGKGRLAEPEEIVEWIERFFTSNNHVKTLIGKKVLVTAGPTIEPLDPVRYFSNYSSGKMGFALAEAAALAGAEVTLISGPVSLPTPPQVRRIDIVQAEEMKEEVLQALPQMDVIIKSAAVADYRPQKIYHQKMKKVQEELTVILEKTPDIATEVGKRKLAHQLLVGFAAETQDVETYALGKLKKKGMDLIVANNVAEPGAGFGIDTNIVTVYDQEGVVKAFPKMSKKELAVELITLIGDRLHGK
ncbi:bifunctional phosphopantothenoylcysteine decarboxylase/phosphopantothenate--cysteine ligase CoaBC [Thermoflavimicrobium daqui]|jgi:phosphopantothenoylcysteine decarboxylase/phosphopantothenate--cysteine ligase|uniref:Coenzyme A biosynthesis bifunctional protein CoaBC n=1 Tax=Thermoflavimicrobium daqui TaxID=2137476 RepID=A0A364K736_9BACL|nr:bifunctional phosphopantothenoylcysteine decarboxylase/phosphopantothenate--cysteine ligase CoaBC [Thermoflavimicrobium daqui]RAL26116.1 bifunctional phosphopantothenoylcysteine decarboxylase/phosphopantothenate--cysteine ligase CoaBC [Thermoflavimicrobium daqui]